jgi:AcrR family transcriptional regulator
MDPQKEQIADTFQKHFSHFGYKKTSVDEIAQALKISKKTIYQHFSSKEEIFYYVVYRIAGQYRNKMAKKLEQWPTYPEKLAELIRLIFAEARKWLKQKNDPFEFKYKYEIAELAFGDAYEELIKKVIREGVEQGEFTPVQVDITTRFIQGVIAESMKLLSADPNLNVEEEAVKAALRLVT